MADELRETIKETLKANHIYIDGQCDTDQFITIPVNKFTNQATAEIKSLYKSMLPSLIEIRDLIKKHQIDIGQHRYSDMDRKEIRECCNIDQNDLAIAFLTQIEKIIEEL